MFSSKWLMLLLSLVLLATTVVAQSGRKQKKTPDLPPVQGVPAPSKTPEPPQPDIPEPDPEKEKEKEKARASAKGIILGTDWADMNVSMGMADYVRRACRSELARVTRTLEVRDTGNMSRSDAVKTAKDEERFYVVCLEFQTFGSSYDVRYTIYEPKTAKILGVGSAPIYTDGTGRVSYYSFERAGRDIARQLLNRLDLQSSRIP